MGKKGIKQGPANKWEPPKGLIEYRDRNSGMEEAVTAFDFVEAHTKRRYQIWESLSLEEMENNFDFCFPEVHRELRREVWDDFKKTLSNHNDELFEKICT